MTQIARKLSRFWTEGRRIERTCYLVGAVLLLSGLAHLGVQVVLGGPWEGPVSWRKPTTFGLSFGLTLISVTWVSSFLQLSRRVRCVVLGGFAAASVAEVSLVTLQAWRRVPSHFNFETSFDARVSATLAAFGGVLFVVLGTLFVQALRPQPDVDPELRLAIRVGLAALIGGLTIGAMMIGIGSTLARGGNPQVAYHGAGVLKLAHAVGLHGLAVLPGLAWLGGLGGPGVARPTPRPLPIGVVGYLITLASALVVGAQHGINAASVTGLAVGGVVLSVAVVRAIGMAVDGTGVTAVKVTVG